jgi:hypothetical protein
MSTALPIDMRWERLGHRQIGIAGQPVTVCEVWSGGLGIEGADAAEHLIAAAPRLRTALTTLLDIVRRMDGELIGQVDGPTEEEYEAALTEADAALAAAGDAP